MRDMELWLAIQDDEDAKTRMGWREVAFFERVSDKYMVLEMPSGWSILNRDDGSFS